MSNVYVTKALRKDIPSDAILLSRDQVSAMHWKTIREWKPSSDVWPFRYGIGLLAATSAVTSLKIVHHYRSKMRLGNHGRITMVLPTVALPSILSTYGHFSVVTSSVFFGEECPLCSQTTAACIQVICGTVFPTLVSPFAAFYYAISFGTYDVPPIRRENLSEIGQLWLKLVRGLRTKIPIYMAVNAIIASTITYFEAKSFYKCQGIIQEREEEFRRTIYGDKESS